ncbi:hypothetical protein [Bradyrhizobium sp. CCBAU 11357]|uniref:hypothetical protein n=1 Tax=Bradyrhizobium sp. CCBAU 11357 TaxID=1630808 RepID=UPI002302AD3C|nr:hypothetical protein [Bradyrhizobium sp. CCBAU 11357]
MAVEVDGEIVQLAQAPADIVGLAFARLAARFEPIPGIDLQESGRCGDAQQPPPATTAIGDQATGRDGP